MADRRVVRERVTHFLKISSLRGSGRVGGSESDRYRIQPSTIGQWWQMGEWSGRKLLIFLKISPLRGSGRVGGSKSDRYRIQPSTIVQWWQMGKWPGRELVIFKKFHL